MFTIKMYYNLKNLFRIITERRRFLKILISITIDVLDVQRNIMWTLLLDNLGHLCEKQGLSDNRMIEHIASDTDCFLLI
jgi:hypothetical protein